jgi:hypothetical protein
VNIVEVDGVKVAEAFPSELVITKPQDLTRVFEFCMSHRTRRTLLHAANVTDQFFDLSSGIAGEVLQKLRHYRMRLAIVCPPDTARFSTRFPEMLIEERKAGYFDVFDTREDALLWLAKR